MTIYAFLLCVPERLHHGYPLVGIVDQHLLDEVEQQLVLLPVGQTVLLQGGEIKGGGGEEKSGK